MVKKIVKKIVKKESSDILRAIEFLEKELLSEKALIYLGKIKKLV